VQLFQKSSIYHLPETVVDSEDSPEPVDSGSSSDNEVLLFYGYSYTLISLLSYLALNLFTCTGNRSTHESYFPGKENADNSR